MKNLQYTQINQKLHHLMQQKKYKEALNLTKQSLQIDSSYLPWWKASGTIYAILKDYKNALNSFYKALQLNPNDPAIYNNLGNIKKEQNELEEAEKNFVMAIKLEPNYFIAYNNLGNIKKEQNELEEAEKNYKKSLQLNPNYYEAYYSLGNIKKEQNELEEAEKNYKKVIELNPNYHEAYNNLGVIALDKGKLEQASKYYKQALKIDPNSVNANFNKSLLLLKQGALKEGFKLFEWRKKRDNADLKSKNFNKPLWIGKESLNNKTILIYNEQGLGDTLQFCRYIPMIVKLGANVIFALNDELYDFLNQFEGVKKFIKKGDRIPSFDYYCPLMSLPLAFKTTLKNIPYSESYLKASEDKVEFWKKKISEISSIKIGIVWSGNLKHHNDTNRSIPLEAFVNILPKGIKYISLQKELRDSDKKVIEKNKDIKFFGNELEDFSDTAALCSLMDLVITVDTSVAHLSAALGKKTWILLPVSSDWRWLTQRVDSPWYSSVKLYRAKDKNGCESSLMSIQKDLNSFIRDFK